MTPTWVSPCGTVRLYNADCRAVLPTLSGVDAVVTDPPYGVGMDYSQPFQVYYGNEYQVPPERYGDSWEECKKLLKDTIPPLVRICGGGVFVSSSKFEAEFMWMQCKIVSPKWKLIWFKGASDTRSPIGWKDYETVYVLKKPKRMMHDHFYVGAGHGHVDRDVGHPTPKPIGWALHLVEKGTVESETILDPFMGSGTTGVACVRTGRKFIGVEIEERYFDIAVRRIEAELNRTPLFSEPPPTQGMLLD